MIGYRKDNFETYPDINPNSRDFDYGNARDQIEQINVDELHALGYTGEGIRILVMDTGFNLTHNALSDINVVAQWDVIENDEETSNQTEEEFDMRQDYHGTAVLSTIAAVTLWL